MAKIYTDQIICTASDTIVAIGWVIENMIMSPGGSTLSFMIFLTGCCHWDPVPFLVPSIGFRIRRAINYINAFFKYKIKN